VHPLAFQRWFLFPRHVRRAGRFPEIAGGVRIARAIEGGEVEALFLPGRSSPAPLVVFAHGNAELIDDWPSMLAPYRAMGCALLLPEYRGYGRSAGAPSERDLVDDFAWFVGRALARDDVDAERLVYHGRSLGGGVVTALALRRPPRAMVLTSTFASAADLFASYFVPRFLVLDPFDNEAAFAKLDLPILLAHGRRDGLVPYSHAERLERAARDATLVTYDADHNDCPPDEVEFFERVRVFLERAGVLSPPDD
jgi:pimeloyl-ACP methyl ester carboxylesterase